jgi:hypothetical protein
MDSIFAREVVAIANMIQQQIYAFDWDFSLPGLGIPSDVSSMHSAPTMQLGGPVPES